MTRLIREDAILHAIIPEKTNCSHGEVLFLIRAYNEAARVGEVISTIKNA